MDPRIINNELSNVPTSGTEKGGNQMLDQEIKQAAAEVAAELAADESTKAKLEADIIGAASKVAADAGAEAGTEATAISPIEKIDGFYCPITPAEALTIIESKADFYFNKGYKQPKNFIRAIKLMRQANRPDDEINTLIIKFYKAWCVLGKGANKEFLQQHGITDADIKLYRSHVFGLVDSIVTPAWYRKAMDKLSEAEMAAELAADVGYVATKVVGKLGSRIPEAAVEVTADVIINTSRGVKTAVRKFQAMKEEEEL